MKLCNINTSDGIHLGLFTERGVVDATAAGFQLNMDEVIEGGAINALSSIAEDASLPTVTAPEYANVVNQVGKIVCAGLNYSSHTLAIKKELPKYPVLFSKFANALAPAGSAVSLPAWEISYDYEAELVIVMGKTAWNVEESEAMDYVFGYTCGNDLSCRTAQKRSVQWLIGKTMPGFGPCGPCIVTRDELDPMAGKSIKSYVNGQLRQDGSTADMIFNCAQIISYASKYTRLEPGDLIFTGTPSGVALEQHEEERQWLKKGDVVDVVIEGIGTLTNKMI